MKFKQKPYLPIQSSDDDDPFLKTQSSRDENDSSRWSSSTIRGAGDSTSRYSRRRTTFFSGIGESAQSARCLVCLFLINLGFTLFNVYWDNDTRMWERSMKWWCPITPDTPLLSGIRYEHKVMQYKSKGYDPFKGDITPEMETAWWDLKKFAFFRATKEEMIKWGEYGEDSVTLSNGGYMAGFRVYHELHCLEWLKMEYSNPDVYIDPVYEADHLDHCVGMLLHGVQCRGDVMTSSWYLDHEKPGRPQIGVPDSPHICVDWSSLEDWIRPRQLEEVGRIQEPAIGPDGELMSQLDVLTHSMPH